MLRAAGILASLALAASCHSHLQATDLGRPTAQLWVEQHRSEAVVVGLTANEGPSRVSGPLLGVDGSRLRLAAADQPEMLLDGATISYVRHRNTLAGAIQGALIGGAFAFLPALAVGMLLADCGEIPCSNGGHIDRFLVGVGGVMVLPVLVGALLGSAMGKVDELDLGSEQGIR